MTLASSSPWWVVRSGALAITPWLRDASGYEQPRKLPSLRDAPVPNAAQTHVATTPNVRFRSPVRDHRREQN
jgi:hypothetical protein